VCDLETSRMGAPCIYDISRLRVKNYKKYSIEVIIHGPCICIKKAHQNTTPFI